MQLPSSCSITRAGKQHFAVSLMLERIEHVAVPTCDLQMTMHLILRHNFYQTSTFEEAHAQL